MGVKLEAEAEKRNVSKKIKIWRQANGVTEEEATKPTTQCKSHVALPTQSDIDKALLEKRKRMLMEKYGKDTKASRQLAGQVKVSEATQDSSKEKPSNSPGTDNLM